jgi:hypothetical protein
VKKYPYLQPSDFPLEFCSHGSDNQGGMAIAAPSIVNIAMLQLESAFSVNTQQVKVS